MDNYTHRDIINWLLKAFPVAGVVGKEVNFPCPQCQHSSFYFNVRKRRGYCHRDSCHWKPSLDNLISVALFSPERNSGPVDYLEDTTEESNDPVTLPDGTKRVVDMENGIANDPASLMALYKRKLTISDIVRFKLRSDYRRIYVPVYENGVLVQYVSRFINRGNPPEKFFDVNIKPKYLYHPRSHINNYFLGWDECKYWEKLTLVENTFVSIWLRNVLNCTTNFGSNLSDRQVQKIVKSKVKSVVLLWDWGAEESSERALKKLRRAGVPTQLVILSEAKPQPDDHCLEYLVERINEIRP